MSELPQDGLPSSEDLDAFVEEQRIADATREVAESSINKVNESLVSGPSLCSVCSAPSTRICKHCGQYFCARCQCVSHEMLTSSEPLVDDEGVAHRGRRILLIGEGWPNALQMLDSLTDEQIEERLVGLRKLLKQAIETSDYAQISIAAHEFKLDYRRHSRYVAAIKRREKIQQGSIRLNSKKHRMDAKQQSIPADIAALMKLGNISYEKAVKVKTLLGKK